MGIASLREELLDALPEALWSAGPSIRVADLGGNKLTEVPASLAVLNSLQRLRLSHNQLSQEGIPWTALAALPHLAVLALDHNRWALPAHSAVNCPNAAFPQSCFCVWSDNAVPCLCALQHCITEQSFVNVQHHAQFIFDISNRSWQ